jgi:hypothetical protein
VLTCLSQPRYNNDVTRLSTQGCNNLVIQSCKHVTDLSEQPCNKSDDFDKVVTSCQQVVPNLLTTCDKQCEYILLTACCHSADLLQDVSFYVCNVLYSAVLTRGSRMSAEVLLMNPSILLAFVRTALITCLLHLNCHSNT